MSDLTQRDVLQRQGWEDCKTCWGTGLDPVDPFKGQPYGMDAYGNLKYVRDFESCPVCAFGLVPPKGMVEVAAQAHWSTEGRDNWSSLSAIRVALIAAARWEGEK